MLKAKYTRSWAARFFLNSNPAPIKKEVRLAMITNINTFKGFVEVPTKTEVTVAKSVEQPMHISIKAKTSMPLCLNFLNWSNTEVSMILLTGIVINVIVLSLWGCSAVGSASQWH